MFKQKCRINKHTRIKFSRAMLNDVNLDSYKYNTSSSYDEIPRGRYHPAEGDIVYKEILLQSWNFH